MAFLNRLNPNISAWGVVMGDFNEILFHHDKKERRARLNHRWRSSGLPW